MSNPFDLTKASDFEPDDIFKLWVDFVGEAGLMDLLKPNSLQPMLMLGSKGSGKTHLMRYCSAEVQRLRYAGGLLEAVDNENFLGVYVRADGMNLGRFRGRGQPDDRWSDVFRYYFELWAASEALTHFKELCDAGRKEIVGSEVEVVDAIQSLFDRPFDESISGLTALRDRFTQEIRNVNFAVGNCQRVGSLDVTIRFSPGSVLFGMAKVLATLVPERRPVLLYLIDELENFSDDQQRFVNTLIRYRRERCSIRVGSRLYGVRTLETDGAAGEVNKPDSEYSEIHLDEFLRQGFVDTGSFLRRLAAKRLQAKGFIASEIELTEASRHLDKYLQVVDSSDFYREITISALERFPPRERPHLVRLRKHLARSMLRSTGQEPDYKLVDSIVEPLTDPQYPLLEKVNIFLFYRAMHDGEENLAKAANRIGSLAVQFKGGSRSGEYYWQLDHYSHDLLAQILRDARRKPLYAGLDTFAAMSQGIPRSFIALLKHVYDRSKFNGEQPFRGGKISLESQQEGVSDAAEWFARDAQPDQHGTKVRKSVEHVAELMREIRFSDKPSECSVSTFSIDSEVLGVEAQALLRHAENWSFLIRVREGHFDKNSKRVEQKFQINSILAPRWGLSISRRGVIQLSSDLGEAIFSLADPEKVRGLIASRVRGMKGPHFGRSGTAGASLFGPTDED